MQKLFKFAFLFLIVASNFAFSQTISIATGGTGGVYYPMEQGLASILSTKVSWDYGSLVGGQLILSNK